MCLFFICQERREMSESSQLHGGLTNPPRADFVFEIGTQRIKDQMEISNALDTKTGIILGFIVVSVAEVVGIVIQRPTPVIVSPHWVHRLDVAPYCPAAFSVSSYESEG
jgi:hypothetical protein